jgi:hypothetical protein
MGTIRVDIEIQNPARPGEHALESVVVDTGAELSWVPAELLESLGIPRVSARRFRLTDGSVSDQPTGEPGDLVLLGARSLEGLNLRLQPVTKVLPYTSILMPADKPFASAQHVR